MSAAAAARWHVYPTRDDLEARAAVAIARIGQQAIAARGRFAIVLAGGATPGGVYRRLASLAADWRGWHVYFGDERCLPAGDAGRNDRMARDAWLDHVPIPAEQVQSVPAELGPSEAATRYAEVLRGVDRFDLVLLGLGEDGHVASLFPGGPAERADVIAVFDAPKPPPERVSLSASRLSRACEVFFIVSGATKRRAVTAWRRGDALPARQIAPPGGVDVLLDAAAWGNEPL